MVTTVAVAVVWSSGQPPRSSIKSSSTDSATSPLPAEMVVWTDHFQVEVVSSRDGHRIRTLASSVAENRGNPTLSASRSHIVYFDNAFNQAGVPSERIMSVPLSGGSLTAVARGRNPAVSPNGLFLAYISDSDLAFTAQAILVRDLRTGSTRQFVGQSPEVDLRSLSWSPDSRSLSFTAVPPWQPGQTPKAVSWILDTQGPSNLLSASRPIPLRSGITWAGYRTSTQGMGVVNQQGGTELVGLDPRTGRVVKHLGLLRETLATANGYDGTEGTVVSDPSGRYLILAANGTGSGRLYRFTVGAAVPARVTDRVLRAAWVP